MDRIELKTSDSEIDLESGENTSEDDRISGSHATGAKKLLGRAWSGLFQVDKTKQCPNGSKFYKKVSGSCNDLAVNLDNEMFNKVESELLNFVDKKMVKEKRKKISYKKPSKPPRPPKGPSLDAADIKMVREFCELAALKRKRIERMKTLRNVKTEKGSSFNGNLFAMLITVLFCFVIISQGLLGSHA